MRTIPLVLLILVSSGCVQNQQAPDSQNVLDCIKACQAAKNLESGPCLLDPEPENKNWVCDVAHDPRQDVDNLPENQCKAYLNGTAQHFVEVTTNCKLIRTV